MQVREAESGAEFVVAEGGAETEGGQRRGGLARGFGYDVFAFGTFFVAGRFLRGWPVRGSFGCEDYSLAAAALRLAGGWGFDAQAQEHVAAAEVVLGGVVEGVLFSDAGPGCGAQGFDLVRDRASVHDAEFDFDFRVCFFGLGHGDSVGAVVGGSQKI